MQGENNQFESEEIAVVDLFAENLDDRLNATAAGSFSSLSTLSTLKTLCSVGSICCTSVEAQAGDALSSASIGAE